MRRERQHRGRRVAGGTFFALVGLLGLLLALPVLGQGAGGMEPPAGPDGPAGGWLRGSMPDEGLAPPYMRPDAATLRQWSAEYDGAPAAPQARPGQVRAQRAVSLLDHLTYVPAERRQGSCGNCWAWAGTAVLEVALSVQEGIRDRLSLQGMSSCRNDGRNDGCVCCGGSLANVTNWYNSQGYAIPWSNDNAQWQDADRQCTNYTCTDTARACAEIAQYPRYPIRRADYVRIETYTVSQEQAIANIKAVLDQNKAIYFSFYMPTALELNWFNQFWQADPETMVWNPSYPRDKVWIPGQGAGHAVTCVGYDDSDPQNRYWIMLNSWGNNARRPTGLFRMAMDMDYGNYMNMGGGPQQSFFWMTVDAEFGDPLTPSPTAGGPTPTLTPSPTVTRFVSPTPQPSLYVWQQEAERGSLQPLMAVARDEEASDCGYVRSLANSTGDVSFEVTVPHDGLYWLWARARGLSWTQNSFYVSLDGGSEFVYEVSPAPGNAWTWHWERVHPVDQPERPVSLSAGRHSLIFRAREPQAGLDVALVTNLAGHVPVGRAPCQATPTGAWQRVHLPVMLRLSP